MASSTALRTSVSFKSARSAKALSMVVWRAVSLSGPVFTTTSGDGSTRFGSRGDSEKSALLAALDLDADERGGAVEAGPRGLDRAVRPDGDLLAVRDGVLGD